MIKIEPVGDRYNVYLSPPEGPTWRSSKPLTATEVLERLSALGCHSTDITDALSATGTDWAADHDREVDRRHDATE